MIYFDFVCVVFVVVVGWLCVVVLLLCVVDVCFGLLIRTLFVAVCCWLSVACLVVRWLSVVCCVVLCCGLCFVSCLLVLMLFVVVCCVLICD